MSYRARRYGIFAILAAVACAGPPPIERETKYGLAERLPLASVAREPSELRFGTAEAAPYMSSGWIRVPRYLQGDAEFMWSKGPTSAIRLPLIAVRDLEIRFRCRPYRFPEAPAQSVSVEVNGEPVETFELQWGANDYDLAIPASVLVEGNNRIVFRYGYTTTPERESEADSSPSQGAGRTRRDMAVAWYSLRVENAIPPAEGEPLADSESGRLFLPMGHRLDYFFELPAHSELEIGEWTWSGSGGARVEVVLETDDVPAALIATAAPDSSLDRVALTGDEGAVVRLALRALPAPGSAVDGVSLHGAVIRVPSDPADGASTADAPEPIAKRPERPPNLVIYMIDTLRADHLGTYGYELPVSPRIDRFGEEATVFDNAVGQSSWTRASVASVLTGLWPVAHGANRRGDKLSDEALTLGEIVQKAGYRTAAIGTNPNVSGAFGFRQGFDEFVMLRNRPRADLVNQLAFDWLDRLDGETPFFLYLHTVEPHDPYAPPKEYRERFAPEVSPDFASRSKQILKDLRRGDLEPEPKVINDLLALYDAEIAVNDEHFGRLLDGLRERGLYDETMIVLVSDHGEEFYEHGGWTHGRTLQSESVNVPLIVRFPGQTEGRRVDAPVQHIDVLPTVLESLGLPAPSGLEGESLAAVAATDGAADERRIFSYLELDQVTPREHSPISHLTSVVVDQWKLVHDLASPSPIPKVDLYRWRQDGSELEDLSEEYPVLAGYLRTLTAERLLAPEERLEAEQAVIDKELEESLRALGYLP